MSEQSIRQLIQSVLEPYCQSKEASLPDDFEVAVTVTRDVQHGDFASNVAFKLARVVRLKPAVIAEELIPLLMESSQKAAGEVVIDRIELAGGGFINFYLSKSSLSQILLTIHKEDRKYGASRHGAGKKVLLEYVSANPTGPLTIAHGRQAAVGDCLLRILKTTGHDAQSEYYLNDAGRQMNLLGQSLWARYMEELNFEAEFPEDGYQGDYIREIAASLVEEKKDALVKGGDDVIAVCRDYAASAMMEKIREDLAKMQVPFDSYFRESSLYEKKAVEKTLEHLNEKGFLFEEDGAQWLRSTDFGDDKDRVVRKSSGDYTYLAPDIAYHRNKFSRGYNWLINFWGPDHHGYVPRMKAACQALGHNAEELDVRIVQLTTLYRKGEPVRMSTRAGEFVTLKELYDEVGVDAARFFFIVRRVDSHLDFDLDLAKEKSQDNPVYYLQYAHARIASILRFSERALNLEADLTLLTTKEETNLIKLVSEFPKILVQAGQFLEPYRVADYLRELAACFHRFYQVCRVVSEDEAMTDARLVLIGAVQRVMRNGLEVLGISQPDSM